MAVSVWKLLAFLLFISMFSLFNFDDLPKICSFFLSRFFVGSVFEVLHRSNSFSIYLVSKLVLDNLLAAVFEF